MEDMRVCLCASPRRIILNPKKQKSALLRIETGWDWVEQGIQVCECGITDVHTETL